MSNEHPEVSLVLLPTSIQAVVFDLGGVLTTGLGEALADMVQVCGGLSIPWERLSSVMGSLYIEASLGHIHPDELWRRFRQSVDLGSLPVGQEDQEFLSRIHLREPDIAATLAALKERYIVGLLSNHVGRWARALLERFALMSFFDAVLISSDIGARKPDLLTYERICQLLDVPPEHSVYIADEEEDLIGCQDAGMFPIFIPGEDASSSVGFRVESVSDLLHVL